MAERLSKQATPKPMAIAPASASHRVSKAPAITHAKPTPNAAVACFNNVRRRRDGLPRALPQNFMGNAFRPQPYCSGRWVASATVWAMSCICASLKPSNRYTDG